MKRIIAGMVLMLAAGIAGAQVKISGLPAASTPLAGTEVVPCVQSGVTDQCTVSSIGLSPQIANNTVLGNTSGSTGPPSAISTVIPNGSLNVNSSGSAAPPTATYTGDVYATAYGVTANAISAIRTLSINSGSAALTATGASFKSSDVGKVISVPGAGVTPTISSVSISNTTGGFTCTCTGLAVGMTMEISGTLSGSGSIGKYTNPTYYYVSATDGVSVFTLQAAMPLGTALVTVAGTTTGWTFAVGPQPLITTISGYTSAIQVTLAANASTTVSSTPYVLTYGTDDSTALASATTACNIAGSRLWLPTGNMLLSSNTSTVNTCALLGSGGAGTTNNGLNGSTFLMISTTVKPFIATNNFLFRNLTFFYPNNEYAPANIPIIYPPLISDNGTGSGNGFNHGILEDDAFVNPTTVMQTTPNGNSGDVKVLNNIIWAYGGAFKLNGTGDSWTFANNRFTPGPAVGFCNFATACKNSLSAGATMNAIFEANNGSTEMTIAWTGGETFLWRYGVIVDSGGAFGSSVISGVAIDGIETIVDSSSGGTYNIQNLITGTTITTCAPWTAAPGPIVAAATCFNLGSGSGLQIIGSMIGGSEGSFIIGNGSTVLLQDVSVGTIGNAQDGGQYYVVDLSNNGNHLTIDGGSFGGVNGNANVHAINIGTNQMVRTLVNGAFFQYFNDIFLGATNNLVQITNSASFGTNAGGTTINLTGVGPRDYVGNYWDVTPSGANAAMGSGEDVEVFTTTGTATWTKPTQILGQAPQSFEIIGCGSGGGGGGGAQTTSGTAASGGASGGGAGCGDFVLSPTQVSNSSYTITVAAGGTGGTGASSSSAAGGNGGTGAASQFGSFVFFGGGGGGAGGQINGNSGGGGGGLAGQSGAVTGSSSTTSAGAAGAISQAGMGSPGNGGSGAAGTTAYAWPTAGQGGSGSSTTAAFTGVPSTQGSGAASGGSGGPVTSAPASVNGGNGARALSSPCTATTGGSSGTPNGGSATSYGWTPGCSGAGGYGNASGNGGNGGNGAQGAPGGGGGSVLNGSTPGNGGTGGNGFVVVITR
jgi:hypothetical protein